MNGQNVDPVQTPRRLLWVYTVCPAGLSQYLGLKENSKVMNITSYGFTWNACNVPED